MTAVKTLPAVEIRRLTDISAGGHVNSSLFQFASHAGTHLDAPLHVLDGGRPISDYPLEAFAGQGCCVSVEKSGPDGISPDDLEHCTQHLLRAGDILLLSVGWDRFFDNDVYFLHPYLTPEAAEWLIEAKVKMVGIDALGVDMPSPMRPAGYGVPVHKLLLSHDVLIAENLRGLPEVAGRRLNILAHPLNMEGADGAPARIIVQVSS